MNAKGLPALAADLAATNLDPSFGFMERMLRASRIGFLGLSVVALVVCAARRRRARPSGHESASARPEPTTRRWALVDSPYGPGMWLARHGTEVSHALIPPGAKASHDESDLQRQGWRHLTIDSDLAVAPAVTVLDAHEVYTMVSMPWRGWVLEQSIRHSGGTVAGPDSRASRSA